MKWQTCPGITPLGDAAHLMTPFAGVEVNVALADSLSLAKALLKRKHMFDDDLSVYLANAVHEYEKPMFERARENMEKSWTGLQHHFRAGGVEERVERLHARAKQMKVHQRTLEGK